MSGAFLGNIKSLSVINVALTPVAVAANTTSEQTFTVNGLQAGDYVEVTKPSAQAGIGVVNDRVAGANTLAITYANTTAGSLTPASETYQVLVVRPEAPGATLIQS